MSTKAEDLVPEGLYCYHHLEPNPFNPMRVHVVGRCPFWVNFPPREEQGCGYCILLQKGDWGENGTMLLWDLVKECGINDDIDFESLMVDDSE